MKNNIRFKGKIILATIFIQLQINNSSQAIFTLEDFDSVNHVRHYNSLPEVEDADANVRQIPSVPLFLQRAESLVAQYKLEPYVGLRLIHKHFPLSDGQLMIEEYHVVDGIPSLVTSPHALEETIMAAIPSSWIFSNNLKQDPYIFEASTDPAVKEAITKLKENPEFFDEMRKLLTEYELLSFFSVAILQRTSLIVHEGQSYLEESYTDPNESIIQVCDDSKISPNAITTTWSFKGPREMKCTPSAYCSPRMHGHKIIRNHLRQKAIG
ncbi:MAG: hypothetical protein K2Y08_05305 [Alphaproteobacteria bacterium]|nr:hypothetical protein [Alphaproteobacteria bacterium]